MVDVRAARELRRLVDRVGRLERQIRAQARASQARNRSVEGGSFAVYDEDGVLRSVVGDQGDGSYTIRDHNGPIPQAPGSPEVTPFPGGVLVSWDGTFEGSDPFAAPADFMHVEVHAGKDTGFIANDDTQRGTIPNVRGGSMAIRLEAGARWRIALQTVTTSRKESAKSEEVEAVPFGNGGVEAKNESFILGNMQDSVKLRFDPLANSEHVYWGPDDGAAVYQDETEWARDGRVITLLDPNSIMAAGDRIDVEYLYLDSSASPALVGGVYTSGVDNPVSIPAGAKPGQLLILFIMLSSGAGANYNDESALNGWTKVGQTASATGTAGHVYRLAIYSKVATGGDTVPTFPVHEYDTPWMLGAYDARTITDMNTAATTGSNTGVSPAPTGRMADLRVWGSISNSYAGTIVAPAGGTIVAQDNDNMQIDIVAVTGLPNGSPAATCSSSTAGWCMATLAIEG